MKTTSALLGLAFCLIFVGCNSHSAEVTAYANERSEVNAKMATAFDANPTEAGLDEARKIFDSRKDDLKAKHEAIKKLDLSLVALKPILDAQVSDSKIWSNLLEKHGDKIASFKDKYYKLQNDFDKN